MIIRLKRFSVPASKEEIKRRIEQKKKITGR